MRKNQSKDHFELNCNIPLFSPRKPLYHLNHLPVLVLLDERGKNIQLFRIANQANPIKLATPELEEVENKREIT